MWPEKYSNDNNNSNNSLDLPLYSGFVADTEIRQNRILITFILRFFFQEDFE